MKWLALLLVLLMCGAASAATSDFGYYKIITINQTMVNQSIGTSQYPLLISITDANLSARCQADGDDIVFYDADNTTQLAHEIELWNSTTGVLVAWVNVTDVINVTHIMMYYYDTDGVNLEDAAGVWDANYVMVHHLQETDIDGGAGDVNDSTQYNNNGTTYNMDSVDQVLGQIDGSFNFDGTNDYIDCGNDVSLDINTNFTIYAWFNTSNMVAHRTIIGCNPSNVIYWYLRVDDDGYVEFVADDDITKVSSISSNIYDDNAWHRAVVVRDSGYYIYVDGDPDGTGANNGNINNAANVTIADSVFQSLFFDGSLDDIRISNISHSVAYIETDYNNTKYPSLFVSIGDEQSEADATAPSVTSLSGSPNPQGFGENIMISCNVTDAVGVNTVLVGITPPGGSETNYSMTDAAPVFSYNYLDYINGSYSYKIYANDSADNWNNTETGTFDLYSETYIHIKTLKDTYGANEFVNITDPFNFNNLIVWEGW